MKLREVLKYLSFCEKIENVLRNQLIRYAFNKLMEFQQNSRDKEKEMLKKIILNVEKKRMLILKKYWDIWINQMKNENMKKKDKSKH